MINDVPFSRYDVFAYWANIAVAADAAIVMLYDVEISFSRGGYYPPEIFPYLSMFSGRLIIAPTVKAF